VTALTDIDVTCVYNYAYAETRSDRRWVVSFNQ